MGYNGAPVRIRSWTRGARAVIVTAILAYGLQLMLCPGVCSDRMGHGSEQPAAVSSCATCPPAPASDPLTLDPKPLAQASESVASYASGCRSSIALAAPEHPPRLA